MLVTSQLPIQTTKFAIISFQRALVPPPTLKKIPPPMTVSATNSVLLVDKTKYAALQFKWKNNHSRATPLAAKYTLIFCFYN